MSSRHPNLGSDDNGIEVPVSILAVFKRDEMLWIASESICEEQFPPCIRNIMKRPFSKKGSHRIGAILAAFLGQVGWTEEKARLLWSSLSSTEDKIFTDWFQKMHCPKCETIKRSGHGYPDLGISDLNFCQPDKECLRFASPVEHACRITLEEERLRGRLTNIKTIDFARLYDWSSGEEIEIRLTKTELNELKGLMKEMTKNEEKMLFYTRIKVRGRLRPKFILGNREELHRRMLSDLIH